MLIRFYNLGKIKETELDLRPLTVIIGPNNSNKTYIAYSVYGLWQTERRRSLNAFEYESIPIHDSTANVNVDEALLSRIQNASEKNVKEFADELGIFYQDSSGRLFSNTKFKIQISDVDLRRALVRIPRTIPGFSDEDYYEFMFDGEHISIFHATWRQYATQNEGSTLPFEERMVDLTRSVLLRPSFEGILDSNISLGLFARPFLLPAERNAFIMTYKVLANRRLKLLREGQRQLIGGRGDTQRQFDLLRDSGELRYPQPVEDFLDFLSDVELEGSGLLKEKASLREPNLKKNGVRKKTKFQELADDIEKHIQGANKTTFRPTALGGREIVVHISKDLTIDLYNASSSIKQLAPLLLYLRYRAQENDLLIIDEPEMNLHPESQAKLLEILAILVNNGVNVLITTHSPYLLAHLNNLIPSTGTTTAVKRKQASQLYLKNVNSLLTDDQVSAYEMKDDQLKSLKDPDFGIRWDTLSDVSVDLQQKYFAINEKAR